MLTSERNLKLSTAIFAAAEAAADRPKAATSLVAEIWHQLDAKDGFSFSFLDTFSFFGYPSRARDVLLTVIERCMSGTRGRGVARFDVEGSEGVITLDYASGELDITLDGVRERWERRLTKDMATSTSTTRTKARSTARAASELRLRQGASFEFTLGKESVVLYYFKSSVVRLRRTARQKYYRMLNENLVGLSGKERIRERIAALEKKGFRFAGERRIPAREIAPKPVNRTRRKGPAPARPSKQLQALKRELRAQKIKLRYRDKWVEGRERVVRRLERELRTSERRTKTRASIQRKLRTARAKLAEAEAIDPKQVRRAIRELEAEIRRAN